MNKVRGTNPIIGMDFPDPDVIFVNDTFYMISTTMHFFPGGQILRSYDLVHWEHASYVYDRLDSTPGQKLEGNENIYGKGMWAATLRYNEGTFYAAFSCNDTKKTYLYRAPSIEGPWGKTVIDDFFYDMSLLFDEGKAYVVHGHKDVYITELNDDLTGPREGGLNKLVISDEGNPILGFEGSHIYKINGRYWLFNIHSRRDRWRRVETAYWADSLEEDFKGGDILDFTLEDMDSGFAQGGVVEGPAGIWHAILFRDNGAVGRIPVVVDVSFENGLVKMHAAKEFETIDLKPGYEYAPLAGSDDFVDGIKDFWQFNHEPKPELVKTGDGLRITTDKICTEMTQANNTLTQRMNLPACSSEITVDGRELNDGDVAGLAAFQGNYGYAALAKDNGKYFVRMYDTTGVREEFEIDVPEVRLGIDARFGSKDEAEFYWYCGDEKRSIGPVHELQFRLDHFTGCRFGIFCYSTRRTGGTGRFIRFVNGGL